MTSHTNFRCDVIPNMLPVGHNFYFLRACHLRDDLILLKSVKMSPLERNYHGSQAEPGGPHAVSHSDTWVWGRHVKHGRSAKLETQLLRKNTAQYLDLLTERPDLLGNKSLLPLHQRCVRTELEQQWGWGVCMTHSNVLKNWAFPWALALCCLHFHVWPTSEQGEKQTQAQPKQLWQACRLSLGAVSQLPCMFAIRGNGWVWDFTVLDSASCSSDWQETKCLYY